MNLRSNCLPSLTKAIEILALRCLGTAPHSCPQWLKRASGVFEQEKDAAKNMIDEIVCMVQNVNNTSSLSDSFINPSKVKCRRGKKIPKRKTPCDFHAHSQIELRPVAARADQEVMRKMSTFQAYQKHPHNSDAVQVIPNGPPTMP